MELRHLRRRPIDCDEVDEEEEHMGHEKIATFGANVASPDCRVKSLKQFKCIPWPHLATEIVAK